MNNHLIDLFIDHNVTQPAGSHDSDLLIAIPQVNRSTHGLAECIAPFRRRLIGRIVRVHHHRNHRHFAAGQDAAVKKTERVSYADLRPQLIAPRDVKLFVSARTRCSARSAQVSYSGAVSAHPFSSANFHPERLRPVCFTTGSDLPW
jgi:hypothetical protein